MLRNYRKYSKKKERERENKSELSTRHESAQLKDALQCTGCQVACSAQELLKDHLDAVWSRWLCWRPQSIYPASARAGYDKCVHDDNAAAADDDSLDRNMTLIVEQLHF